MSKTINRPDLLFGTTDLKVLGQCAFPDPLLQDPTAAAIFAIHEELAEAGKLDCFSVEEAELLLQSAENALKTEIANPTKPQER